MERLFYSPTQFAKEIKDVNPSVEEIDYFINFNHIREAREFDNYNARPITIKIIGGESKEDTTRDIRLNISKQLYSRMNLYNESRNDEGEYLCLRTNCKEEKIYNAIDGEHKFYSTKVLLVPNNTLIYKEIEQLETEQRNKNINIESIENDFTL